MGRNQSIPDFADGVKEFPLHPQSSEKSLKGFDRWYDMIRFAFWKDDQSLFGYRRDWELI